MPFHARRHYKMIEIVLQSRIYLEPTSRRSRMCVVTQKRAHAAAIRRHSMELKTKFLIKPIAHGSDMCFVHNCRRRPATCSEAHSFCTITLSSSSRYKFIIESSGARYKTMHMVEALSCLGNLFVCAVCVYSLASVSEWMRRVRARLPWCMHACTLYETVHLPKSVIIDFWHGIHTVSRRQLHYFFFLLLVLGDGTGCFFGSQHHLLTH